MEKVQWNSINKRAMNYKICWSKNLDIHIGIHCQWNYILIYKYTLLHL